MKFFHCFVSLSLVVVSTGLICWECEDAYGHDECQRKGTAVMCEENQDFCHLELRNGGWGQQFWVEKTCKTRKSCEDNTVQNYRSAWALDGEQIQCNLNFPSSVCRCCCSGDLCNQNKTECDATAFCPAITAPRRGRMECTFGFGLLSECEFSCRPGFALEGPSSIQCDGFGAWTNTTPSCVRITCENAIQTPRLATQTCTKGRDLGSRCRFTCSEGYRIEGSSTIQCIDDVDGDRYGVWSAMPPRCILPCPPSAIMDFVVVMDSSSSVRESGWNKMKDFVISFLKDFRIQDDAVQVAVIRYNSNVDRDNEILLDSYKNNKEGFFKAFKNLPYEGSGTRTGRALNYVARRVLQRGNRELARDVVFVMTDGKSQDRVYFPSLRLRRRNALIYVLPIQVREGGVDLAQIRRIAGPGNEANILTGALTGGFDALNEAFAHNITTLLCHQPCFNPFHDH